MAYSKLLTAASLLALIPSMANAAEVALFPDLDTAKTAYKAEDYAKAAQHWMPLAHKGNDVAQLELGKLYSRGLGVVQRDNTALNLFMESAKQGNNRAMFEIGRAYESGKGVPRDIAKAKEWYSMAADAGYSRGNFAIGSLYEKNKLGTPKKIAPDTKNKLRTIVNDIKAGNFSQAETIALAYEDGVSVLPDPQTALTYYYLANKVGSDSAQLRIKTLEEQLSTEQKTEANRQANMLFASSDKTIRDERRTLINNLKSFKSPAEAPAVIETQKENALEYYEKASAQGYVRAERKIADIKGEDIPEYITPPKPPKRNIV
jgi:TPR repeat protein